MSRDWIALPIFTGICFAVGASGSVFTASSVKTWYPRLLKPAGTPPSWLFGPVWSLIYLLMAVAAGSCGGSEFTKMCGRRWRCSWRN